jgi:hypothetical protein
MLSKVTLEQGTGKANDARGGKEKADSGHIGYIQFGISGYCERPLSG